MTKKFLKWFTIYGISGYLFIDKYEIEKIKDIAWRAYMQGRKDNKCIKK